MSETMGDRIRTLREFKGLTRAALADLCDVPESKVTAWELGYPANIKLREIVALVKALDTTPEYLVNRDDKPTEPGGGSPKARRKRATF